MRIGTMFFGRVEPVAGECIETKFLVIGVPLAPIESVYVMDEGSRQGIALAQVHGTSVLAGYLRLFLALGAIGLGILGYVDGGVGSWLGAAVCLAAWLWSMIGLGKLSERERAQRTVLRALTGIGAPPEILPAAARAESERILRGLWSRIRSEDGLDVPEDWREARSVPAALRLVHFALARYDGADYDAIWDAQVDSPSAPPTTAHLRAA